MVNNAALVLHLASQFSDAEHPPLHTHVPVRERVQSDPCLPVRLPSTAFLQREADQVAPKAMIRQLRRTPTPTSPSSAISDEETQELQEDDGVDQQQEEEEEEEVLSRSRSERGQAKKPWKDPEPFEIFRAIEKKDIMFLMEVRDRAFHLLLRKNGDVTPLVHTMRIGKSHQDVAVVLLGAFSRYINNLGDDEMSLPRTKTLLRALRVNLRLAIDFGLQMSQSDLIASFLQTLIMSEGDKWVSAQVANLVIALRLGTEGKPVKTADTAVRGFATKELGKAKIIAAFEDYVGNATADLLMMAAWSCALQGVDGEPIPTYYFARDDRVYKAFVDRLDKNKVAVAQKLGRRLRWQIRVLRKVMEGRSTSYHSKVDTLAEEFDQGTGV
ncbi:hypothetical protein B0H21DRAFT_692334 [Amylocystis lapponica]|nr:hypothetical protein B0H21DRAFT_692334 [Amylocystis lapponica]